MTQDPLSAGIPAMGGTRAPPADPGSLCLCGDTVGSTVGSRSESGKGPEPSLGRLRLAWLRLEPAFDPRFLRPGLDDPGHDPAVLADLAVTNEPELLVSRQGTVEEESGRHGVGALRVSLDGPAAQTRDEIERTGERRRGNALTPVPLTGVAARDPPVRRGRPAFVVRGAVLDPRHLVGGAEL